MSNSDAVSRRQFSIAERRCCHRRRPLRPCVVIGFQIVAVASAYFLSDHASVNSMSAWCGMSWSSQPKQRARPLRATAMMITPMPVKLAVVPKAQGLAFEDASLKKFLNSRRSIPDVADLARHFQEAGCTGSLMENVARVIGELTTSRYKGKNSLVPWTSGVTHASSDVDAFAKYVRIAEAFSPDEAENPQIVYKPTDEGDLLRQRIADNAGEDVYIVERFLDEFKALRRFFLFMGREFTKSASGDDDGNDDDEVAEWQPRESTTLQLFQGAFEKTLEVGVIHVPWDPVMDAAKVIEKPKVNRIQEAEKRFRKKKFKKKVRDAMTAARGLPFKGGSPHAPER